MYHIAKRHRAANKAKAERLAGPSAQRVDASSWRPQPLLNAEAKTGLRPISPRAYKKGGKVVKCEGGESMKRTDRPGRKSGGAANFGTSMANKNMKKANESREGIKHVGALKHGGTAKCKDGVMPPDAGTNPIKPVRAKAEHYKHGGKHYAEGGSWLAKATGTKSEGQKQQEAMPDPKSNVVVDYRKMKSDTDRLDRMTGRKHGGKAEHPDVAEDKALVRKMVKSNCLTGKKEGGAKWIQKAIKHPGALHKSLHVPEGEKIPAKKLHAAAEKGGKLGKRARLAETLKRMGRATGGQTVDKDVNVNIYTGPKTGPMGSGMLNPLPGAAPAAPSANLGAAGAPPPAMLAGLPAAQMAGLGAPNKKAGGRITKHASSYKDMEAGAGSGEGRLQKEDIAKLHKDAPARKHGGKVRR